MKTSRESPTKGRRRTRKISAPIDADEVLSGLSPDASSGGSGGGAAFDAADAPAPPPLGTSAGPPLGLAAGPPGLTNPPPPGLAVLPPGLGAPGGGNGNGGGGGGGAPSSHEEAVPPKRKTPSMATMARVARTASRNSPRPAPPPGLPPPPGLSAALAPPPGLAGPPPGPLGLAALPTALSTTAAAAAASQNDGDFLPGGSRNGGPNGNVAADDDVAASAAADAPAAPAGLPRSMSRREMLTVAHARDGLANRSRSDSGRHLGWSLAMNSSQGGRMEVPITAEPGLDISVVGEASTHTSNTHPNLPPRDAV